MKSIIITINWLYNDYEYDYLNIDLNYEYNHEYSVYLPNDISMLYAIVLE